MFNSSRNSTSAAPLQTLPEIDENLVEIGGELNVASLLSAYRSGAFPWTVHPVTWWSPDPRAIIEFETFHPSRSLQKFLRKKPFEVTVNRAFTEVIQECAALAPGRRSTWITSEFITAYSDLHRQGHAHSLEIWQHEKLVGGIYGVAIGGYFAGESMFHRVANASKAALYYLVQHLMARDFALLDIQRPTRVTLQMGATLIPRRDFLKRLRSAQSGPAEFGAAFAGAPAI